MRLRELRQDKDFMADVDEWLQNISQLPSLRRQMQSMFGELEHTMIESKAVQSINAAKKVRKNLYQRKKKQEREYSMQVDRLVEATSKSNAARATRLGKLLTKQWYEWDENFKVISGLSEKDKDRINI